MWRWTWAEGNEQAGVGVNALAYNSCSVMQKKNTFDKYKWHKHAGIASIGHVRKTLEILTLPAACHWNKTTSCQPHKPCVTFTVTGFTPNWRHSFIVEKTAAPSCMNSDVSPRPGPNNHLTPNTHDETKPPRRCKLARLCPAGGAAGGCFQNRRHVSPSAVSLRQRASEKDPRGTVMWQLLFSWYSRYGEYQEYGNLVA